MKRFVPSLLVLATVTVLAMHSVEIWSQENQVKENRSAVAKAQEQEKKNVEDKNVPVAGAILQLNKPGTILIEISIGSDDGLKTGDVFVVSRKDKRIGKLTITKCEPDRSTAKIIVVNDGETLQIGDPVANRSASLGAARPPRKMQNKHEPSN